MEIETKKRENGEIICRIKKGNIVYDYCLDANHSTNLRLYWMNENGDDFEKELNFYKSSDYMFWGNKNNDITSTEQIQFEIEKDNLIYQPLKDFLRDEKQIIIDDDSTREENKRFMEIQDKSQQIVISLLDNREQANSFDIYKLNVFIKNILYDGRSKIDRNGLDTKDRLAQFFYEINREFSKQIKYNSYEYSLMKYLKDGEER